VPALGTVHRLAFATHCFGSSLLDILVNYDKNPLDSVERSAALLAMAVLGLELGACLKPAEREAFLIRNPSFSSRFTPPFF
ncbi:MAG: hypothetical protein Q8P67_14145, partial [archaeon]|nr:hypothetical protein [archaeon]